MELAPMAARRRRRSGGNTKLGRAAKACKGKRGRAFRSCVRSKVRGR